MPNTRTGQDFIDFHKGEQEKSKAKQIQKRALDRQKKKLLKEQKLKKK